MQPRNDDEVIEVIKCLKCIKKWTYATNLVFSIEREIQNVAIVIFGFAPSLTFLQPSSHPPIPASPLQFPFYFQFDFY